LGETRNNCRIFVETFSKLGITFSMDLGGASSEGESVGELSSGSCPKIDVVIIDSLKISVYITGFSSLYTQD
jgi:hypothetical protein